MLTPYVLYLLKSGNKIMHIIYSLYSQTIDSCVGHLSSRYYFLGYMWLYHCNCGITVNYSDKILSSKWVQYKCLIYSKKNCYVHFRSLKSAFENGTFKDTSQKYL